MYWEKWHQKFNMDKTEHTHPVLGVKRAYFGFEPGLTAGFRTISTQFG